MSEQMLRIKTEELVETFRVKLGLLPWSEHEIGHSDRRGSGRTTRMILEALAFAALHPDARLYPEPRIVVAVDKSFTVGIREMIRKLALRLEMESSRLEMATHQKACDMIEAQKRPTPWRPANDRRRIQFFVDHYDEEYERAVALIQQRDTIRKGET